MFLKVSALSLGLMMGFGNMAYASPAMHAGYPPQGAHTQQLPAYAQGYSQQQGAVQQQGSSPLSSLTGLLSKGLGAAKQVVGGVMHNPAVQSLAGGALTGMAGAVTGQGGLPPYMMQGGMPPMQGGMGMNPAQIQQLNGQIAQNSAMDAQLEQRVAQLEQAITVLSEHSTQIAQHLQSQGQQDQMQQGQYDQMQDGQQYSDDQSSENQQPVMQNPDDANQYAG